MGNTFGGEVEAVGKAVKLFKKGDTVFACTEQEMGAYAEYLCMPENGVLAPKPSNMTFEAASTVPYGASQCEKCHCLNPTIIAYGILTYEMCPYVKVSP